MLLDTQPKLEDAIVATLATFPGSSVDKLRERIARTYGHYSASSIYQELRKLRERAVCVKVGTGYSLRLGWIQDVASVIELAYARHLDGVSTTIALPSDRMSESWRFTQPRALGQFWTQLILLLCEKSKDKICFEWAPHAWFSIGHAGEESQFIRAMRRARNSYYLIVGNDTELSRRYVTSLRGLIGNISFAPSPFEGERRYISVIGDYLIEVDLGERLNKTVDDIFTSTETSVKGAQRESLGLFDKTSAIRLTLCNKPRRLVKVMRYFYEYFGLTRRKNS